MTKSIPTSSNVTFDFDQHQKLQKGLNRLYWYKKFAGASMTLYYSVGLAGNPFNQEALAKSTICAVTIIGCGNEAIALAYQGPFSLIETQGNAGDTNVMDIATLASYFSVTHTAN